MKRALAVGLAAVAAIVSLAFAALLGFLLLVDSAPVRLRVARAASRVLGRPVRFSSLSVALAPRPAVRIEAVEIGDDPEFEDEPFLAADSLYVAVRLWPLLRGDLDIELTAKRPRAAVVQRADGRLNVASLGAAPRAADSTAAASDRPGRLPVPPGVIVRIEGGSVRYDRYDLDGGVSSYRLDDLNGTLTGGLSVGLKARARLQPGGVEVRVTDGTIAFDQAASLGEAPVRSQLAIEIGDLAEIAALALGKAPAIAGNAAGNLTLAGTLSLPTASGEIVLSRISIVHENQRCPEPRRRGIEIPRVGIDAFWDGKQLLGRPASADVAGGTIRADLTVRPEGPIRVALTDVVIHALPIETVLVDFLCAGYAVTGPLDLTGVLTAGEAGIGSVGRLKIGPGKVVGEKALGVLSTMVRVGGAVSALLSADLPWSLFSSPLDFDSITAVYEIGDGVLVVQDLFYDSRTMKISGGGRYVFSDGEVDFDLVVNHGRGEARVRLTGAANDPSIRVTPTTILRKVDPGGIARGIQGLFDKVR